MRILITGSTYPPCFNGQSIFTGHLAEGLAKRGHQVRALFPSHKKKPFIDNVNGVETQGVYAWSAGFHVDVFYPPISNFIPAPVFKDFKPDIVHVQDHLPMSAYILNYAHQRGIKVVGTNHFLPENWAPYFPLMQSSRDLFDRVLWKWMLGTFNNLDMVTAPSRTAVEILKNVGLCAPAQPISCGVDLNIFNTRHAEDCNAIREKYGIPLDKPVLAFVGRVDGEKKLDVLMKAVKLSDREQVHLVIVGRGAAHEEMKRLAAELGIKNRVHFTGFVPAEELPRVLNCIDIFAMPSEAELLSIATLEAMGCGKPVLAANSRALPELVEPGVNGYLFEPGNAHDAAKFIRILVDNVDQWPMMGASSLQKVQAHSIENMFKSYEDIYLSLINQA
ncbi:MAG: glycosyltransferase [Anaerolineae bacterium]|nr:glycosyltransferase [Anaerolineae bacterium]